MSFMDAYYRLPPAGMADTVSNCGVDRRANQLMSAKRITAGEPCLTCGLCCNGVLFRDVELQMSDDRERLVSLGLPLKELSRRQPERTKGLKSKIPQPCAALCAGNLCRIYEERPSRCREFECALLKRVHQDELELPAALRTIRSAQQRAAKVRRLLRELGDTDESLALSLRFKRVRRRLESGSASDTEIETYADLALAVHELNVVLSREFYPGAKPS